MKIIADENIPYINELFGSFGEVKAISGRQIPKISLNDADALIIRSVTKINQELLADKPIKFVGTTTSGIDHVDDTWLRQVGIQFASAPGCNAIAVVEYIFSALFVLAERDNFKLKDRTIGIVGLGNIGKRLHEYLKVFEVRTLLCDPPRSAVDNNHNFYTIEELIEQVDIITFHTPLFKNGVYKTLHLADKSLISQLKPGSILINTCRGPIVDNSALLSCLKAGQDLSVILDVWELEPEFNTELLNEIDIGTAHIAGYTIEGRTRGTIQIFETYSNFIGKAQTVDINKLLPEAKFSNITLHGQLDELVFKKLVHLIYDVRHDDALLRKAAGIPGEFDKLRKNYLNRREWSSLCVKCDLPITAIMLRKLGFNVLYQKC